MAFTHVEAKAYLFKLLGAVKDSKGSDLFVAPDFSPAMKLNGSIQPLSKEKLSANLSRMLAESIMADDQLRQFNKEWESNFAITVPNVGRFRVNIYRQQQQVSSVYRLIPGQIPRIEELYLPPLLSNLVLERRGLVIVVGSTGSGKTTTLAAMVGHRNRSTHDHIITIEDPVEFLHKSEGCLISHREVGVDTHSWHDALVNALRQSPDVIMIGEVRDADTMEHAIAYADTGHLCLCTLHANNANQALDRIINFFPEQRKNQLLGDLSRNLRSIISLRLMAAKNSHGRRAATEILLNTPTLAEAIQKDELHRLKEIMAQSNEVGMRTFDQSLFELYEAEAVSYFEAISNADSQNDLRLTIKLKSKLPPPDLSDAGQALSLRSY